MSQQRFKNKLDDYIQFAHSGSYQKTFGVPDFRVLIIAPSDKRLNNLKKTAEEATNKHFRFTTLNKLTTDSGFGPIWLRAGHDGLYPLINLTS